ncbi:MAG TPA: phosphotransferase family protein [Myxococcota bacterium]|nr:phosphotransferase family protein [Myxococcota bacterium]
MGGAAAVRDEVPGIRRPAVERFFAEHVPGSDGPLRFALISGGRSNLTYLVEGRGGTRWVLRRPPLGHVLPTAHDMAREYRVLAALCDTPVPVARPIALCDDASVNDAPFYVMEHAPGVVLEHALPAGFAPGAAERQRIGAALIDTLVALHAVDVRSVGLADFGRPEGYLERQVRRWAQQWERSKTAPLPAIEALAERLARALPESSPPTLVHGDYRLGNLALDPRDPGRVVAIYDWEMATLGDPLADLGYTLIYWAEEGDALDARVLSPLTALPGFATRRELVDAYARASGRDCAAIDFYRVLALYKLAVISEGIYARHRMGKTVGEGFAGMQRSAGALAERALAIAHAASDARLRGA